MSELYKSVDEAGLEVRKLGQGKQYQPGDEYKKLTGRDYQPGDVARFGVGGSGQPRRTAISQPGPDQRGIDFLDQALLDAQTEVSVGPITAGNDEPGFFSNFSDLVVEGGKSALASGEVGLAMTAGDPLEMVEKAGLISQEAMRQRQAQKTQPAELKELKDAFEGVGDDWEKADGFWESAWAVGGMFAEIGKQAATNPTGLAYMTGEQIANMVPTLVGAYTGAKGGAAVGTLVAPGPGTAAGALTGGLAGGFVAGSQIEKGAEFIGQVIKAANEMGVEPTEANFKALLSDPKFVNKVYQDATVKGNTTAAIDAALTVLTGGISSGARRGAIKQAMSELPDAATDQVTKRAAEILAQRTTKQVIGRQIAAGTVSTLGEGVSEAGGQLAAYGEVDLGDVGMEIAGGLGGAVVEVPAAAKTIMQGQPKIEPDTSSITQAGVQQGSVVGAATPSGGVTADQTVETAGISTPEVTTEAPDAPDVSTEFVMPQDELIQTVSSTQGQYLLAGLYGLGNEQTRAEIEQLVDTLNLPVDLYRESQRPSVRDNAVRTISKNGAFVSDLNAAIRNFIGQQPPVNTPRMTLSEQEAMAQIPPPDMDGIPLSKEEAQLESTLSSLDQSEQESARAKFGKDGVPIGELIPGPVQTAQEGPTPGQLLQGFERAARNIELMPPTAQRAAAISSMADMQRYGFTPEQADGMFGRFLGGQQQSVEATPDTAGIEVTEVPDISAAAGINDADTAQETQAIDLSTAPVSSERLQTFNEVVPLMVARDNRVWNAPSTAADYAPGNLTPGLYKLAEALGVKLTGYQYRGNNKILQSRNGISTPNGIAINSKSRDQFMTIFGHEVYHSLRRQDPEAAALLEQEILSYISDEGKTVLRDKLQRVGYDPAKVNEEIVADVMGVMFGENQFWQELGVRQPTLLQRLVSTIDKMIQKFSKRGGRKDEVASYITNMEAVRDMMASYLSDRIDANAQAQQADVTQDSADSIDGDPIETIRELAKAGKKMEAARVFRNAKLFDQLRVPFNEFYADAEQDARTDVPQAAQEQPNAEQPVAQAAQTAERPTVVEVSPNTFQGTVRQEVREATDVSPPAPTAREKAQRTRERNEAILSGQYSDENAQDAVRIKLKRAVKTEIAKRATVDGKPVATLFKTSDPKSPFAMAKIREDGTFTIATGPNEAMFDKSLPEGAEVAAPVQPIIPQGQGRLDLSENRSLENKYLAQAERIMLTAFTPSQVTGTLKSLRKQLDKAFESPFFKYRKKLSDVEYVFEQFALETPAPGTDRVGFDRLSGERKEVAATKKNLISALSGAIEAAQKGDVRARAGLLKVHAAKIEDALMDLRLKMAADGLSDQTIDRIIQPRLDSLKALADESAQTIEIEETIEGGNQVDDLTLPLSDPDYSDSRKAAAAAIDEARQNRTSPMLMLRRESMKAEPEFGFSDLRAEMAAQGMEIGQLDREIAQWPAARYTLDYYVQKNADTVGDYNARVAWFDSYQRLERIYRNDAAKLDAIRGELSVDERAFIDDMRQQELNARTRLQERLRKNGDLFDTPESAFPHALFNRYTLNQMRNFEDGSIPEGDKRILRMLANGNVNLLPGVWLNDLSHALNARKDLAGAIMDGLTNAEKAAFIQYQERKNAELANRNSLSERRTYSAQLDQLKDLDKALYDQFSKQIAYADLKSIPQILEHARALDRISQAATDKKQRNLAMDAYLDQLYHSDQLYSTTLDRAADAFNRIAGAEQIAVDETEVDALIEYQSRQNSPIPTRERAREMVLFEKLAQAAADESSGFTPDVEEIAADTDPESQVGLSGDIQYKRGVNSGIVTAAAVSEHVISLTADWPSQPNVSVYKNASQIQDAAVRDRLLARDPSGSFAGAIDPETGAVYIFSDYVRDLADAEFVLFHELNGHWGLRAFLGDRLNAFLENQYRLNKKVKALADSQYDAALETNNPMSRIESIEEAISDMAVTGDSHLFRQLIGQLVAWLRKHNMRMVADWIDSTGTSELAAVLVGARKAVRNGKASPMNGAPSEVLYSRQKQPVEVFATRDGKTTGYARLNPVLGHWTTFVVDANTGQFNAIDVEKLGDVLLILKKVGSVSKSAERDTRRVLEPMSWHEIPSFSDKEGSSKFVRNRIINHQNQYLPIFEVATYLQDKGVENTVVDDLVKYESRTGYVLEQFQKNFMRPIENLLGEIGKKGGTVEDAMRFLYVRHAPERNEYIQNVIDPKNPRGSGIDTKTALDELDSNNGGKWNNFRSELEALGQVFDAMGNEKLSYMLQTGQINQYQYASLSRYKHYVNLSGNIDGDKYDKSVLGNRQFSLKSAEMRRAAGRGTESGEIIENTINSMISSIIRGQQNRVLQSVLDMVERNPDPTFVTVEPLAEKKMINVERMKFDKEIYKYLTDTPTEKAGRDYMRNLQQSYNEGNITLEEGMADIVRRINLAERQQFIKPDDAKTALRRVHQGMVEAGRLTPDGYVSMVADPNIITQDNVIVAKVNGASIAMQFGDKGLEFVNAITGMNTKRDGAFVETMGSWNRFFGQLLTSWNPAWIVPNLFLDAQTVFSNASADPEIGAVLAQKMVRELPKALQQTFLYTLENQAYNKDTRWGRKLAGLATRHPMKKEWRDMMTEYLKDGGGTFFLDRKGLDQTLDKLNRHLNGPTGALENLQNWTEGLTNLLELLGDPSELAPRLAAYKVLREAGWDHQRAVRYGKEITVNFNMKGQQRWLRSLYVFANPAIQGTVRMFKDYSAGDTGVKRFLPSARFATVAGGFMVLGMLSSMLARSIGGEDEDRPGTDLIDRVPIFKRNSSFIIAPDMYGGAIPVAHGWRAFFGVGVHMWDAMTGQVKPEVAAQRAAMAAIDTLMPLNVGSDANGTAAYLATVAAPTQLVPIVQIIANQNRQGGPITKEDSAFSDVKTANAFMHFDSVNPISRNITHALAAATSTGNPKYNPGLIDVNPAYVDFLIQSYLPGVINDTYKLAGIAVAKSEGRNTKEPTIPIIDRFIAKPSERSDIGAMRRVAEAVDTRYSEFKAMDTSKERKNEIRAQNPGLGFFKQYLSAVDRDLRQLSSRLKTIEENPLFTPEYKVKARNKIEEQKLELYRRVVGRAVKAGFKDEVIDAKVGGTLGKVIDRIRD